jgi:hypothetical protein
LGCSGAAAMCDFGDHRFVHLRPTELGFADIVAMSICWGFFLRRIGAVTAKELVIGKVVRMLLSVNAPV